MKDGPVCKIASLSNSAKSKDSRLQLGTIVSDAAICWLSNMLPVRTHTDLRMRYEDAQRCQASLRVRFINTSITSSLIANMPGAVTQSKYGEWTSSGEWKGSTTEGWPGGARCVTTKEARRAKDSRYDRPGTSTKQASHGHEPVRLHPTGQTRGLPASPISPKSAPQDVSSNVGKSLDLDYSTSMAPARHRELPTPVPILRKPTDWKMQTPDAGAGLKSGTSIQKYMTNYVPTTKHAKSKVLFKDSFERRFYDPKMESYRMAIMVSDEKLDSDLTKPGSSAPITPVGTNALIDAVQHKGFMDVIKLLQAGVCPNEKDEYGKTPKDYAKSRLEALESELLVHPENQEVRKLAKDFRLKRKVLSIFIEAVSIINKARFNKKWERIDFKIEKIEKIRLTVRGDDHHGSKVLDCRIRISGDEAKHAMPLIPLDKVIGEWRNDGYTKAYAFKYNGSLMESWPGQLKEIIISLYKGEENRDNTKPIPLGKIVIPFNRIIEEIEDGSGVIKEELTPNDYLLSGAISISAVKTWDKKDLESKAKETAGKLLEVIDYIKQFNDELGPDGTGVPPLSAHIGKLMR